MTEETFGPAAFSRPSPRSRALDPQGIVELAALVSWYVGNSRFTKALRIQPEQAQS